MEMASRVTNLAVRSALASYEERRYAHDTHYAHRFRHTAHSHSRVAQAPAPLRYMQIPAEKDLDLVGQEIVDVNSH